MSLKSLALSVGCASRKLKVQEWDNAVIVIREPDIPEIDDYFDLTKSDNNDKSKKKELFNKEVRLFIKIIQAENGEPIFSESDFEALKEAYGPVHRRIMNISFGLIEESAKKLKATLDSNF